MANFKDCSKFTVHDDYYTTEDTWKLIKHLIPDSVNTIWEACMLNAVKSLSPQRLEHITDKQIIWDMKMDILEKQMDHDSYDMIITNIPFETKIKKKILKKLVEIDKPFIIIVNGLNVFSKYMREIFGKNIKHLQIITPSTKIHYQKLLKDGSMEYKKNTSFYSVFLAYKMDLTTEQLWA